MRQLDTREPHTCAEGGACRNVLIDLRTHSKASVLGHVQCKCIDVNPVKPEQIAVGSMDPYARIYDTRLCSLKSFSASNQGASRDGDLSCVACFSPGHLNKQLGKPGRKHCSTVAATYLTFSADGRDLLVNLSGEQVRTVCWLRGWAADSQSVSLLFWYLIFNLFKLISLTFSS